MPNRADELQEKLTGAPMLPVTPIEAGAGVDIMRAMLATLVFHAPGRRIVVPPDYRLEATGILLKLVMDRDGTIVAWAEPSDPEANLRVGAMYTTGTAELSLGLEDAR